MQKMILMMASKVIMASSLDKESEVEKIIDQGSIATVSYFINAFSYSEVEPAADEQGNEADCADAFVVNAIPCY